MWQQTAFLQQSLSKLIGGFHIIWALSRENSRNYKLDENWVDNLDKTQFAFKCDNRSCFSRRVAEEKYNYVESGGESMTFCLRLSRGTNAKASCSVHYIQKFIG